MATPREFESRILRFTDQVIRVACSVAAHLRGRVLVSVGRYSHPVGRVTVIGGIQMSGPPTTGSYRSTMHCRSMGAFAAAECCRTVSYGAVPYCKIESDPRTGLLSANRIQRLFRKCQTSSKNFNDSVKPAFCS